MESSIERGDGGTMEEDDIHEHLQEFHEQLEHEMKEQVMSIEKKASALTKTRPQSAKVKRSMSYEKTQLLSAFSGTAPSTGCENRKLRPRSAGPKRRKPQQDIDVDHPVSQGLHRTPGKSQKGKAKRKSRYQMLRELESGWVGLGSKPAETETAAGSGLNALRKLSGSRSRPQLSSLKRTGNGSGQTRMQVSKSMPKLKTRPQTDKKYIIFKNMCDRVVSLWEELRVPRRDRDFFYQTYCQVPVDGPKRELREARARVQAQFDLLMAHRNSTLQVLKCIQDREDQLAALRKILSGWSNLHETESLQKADGVLVRGLRQASVNVVQAILAWRKLLWRPHPFMWKGINYLVKMATDASFYAKINSTCQDPITFQDSYEGVPGEDLQRLEQARQVVLSEPALQREVSAEHERLLRSGYYIPMLRWSPDDAVKYTDGNAERPKRSIRTQMQIAREEQQGLAESGQTREEELQVHEENSKQTDTLELDALTIQEPEGFAVDAQRHMEFLNEMREKLAKEL